MVLLTTLVLFGQACINRWTGPWDLVQSVPAWRTLELDNNGWTVPGNLFFFTSSLDRNFLFIGTAVPGRPERNAVFWKVRTDRMEPVPQPPDYRASPNWFNNAAHDSSGVETSHDPRRNFDFRFSFHGLHFRRPALILGRRPAIRIVDAYIGERRLEVFKTGRSAPALVVKQRIWNADSAGELADSVHYDQAFGIMIMKFFRQSFPFIQLVDLNNIE